MLIDSTKLKILLQESIRDSDIDDVGRWSFERGIEFSIKTIEIIEKFSKEE